MRKLSCLLMATNYNYERGVKWPKVISSERVKYAKYNEKQQNLKEFTASKPHPRFQKDIPRFLPPPCFGLRQNQESLPDLPLMIFGRLKNCEPRLKIPAFDSTDLFYNFRPQLYWLEPRNKSSKVRQSTILSCWAEKPCLLNYDLILWLPHVWLLSLF